MPISKSLPRTATEVEARLSKALPVLLENLRVKRVVRQATLGERRVDLLVDIEAGAVVAQLAIEVRGTGEPRFAREAVFQLLTAAKEAPGVYPVFAAPYVTESTRRLCKEAGVGYIDLAGNVYLRFDGVLIDRSTPVAIRMERKALRSLSTPGASRVVRVLLADPKGAFPVTELARRSGVSPAEAYKVANMLEMKGLVLRDAERRISVSKPGDLLDAWSRSLDFRRNLILPAYSLERTPEALMQAVAETARRGNRKYALTMSAGASLVVPFARFYDVTCYVDGEAEWWMKRLDLKPVESGSNVQLVTPRDRGVLESVQEIAGLRVVSDVQLYADLVGSPGRDREWADAIRKRKIGF